MSIFLRSILVAAALVGTVSAASATTYGYGYGAGRWVKVDGKWKHDTRAFFDQLQRNGS